MSKAKHRQKKTVEQAAPQPARRNFLLLGAGALGAIGAGALAYQAGFFSASKPAPAANPATNAAANFKLLPPVKLTADYANALRAAEDITSHYARELMTPWALIHAVRGFGRDFTLSDGAKAVDHLCTKYAEEREVNGKRYVCFQRNAEVHENSFLKTFLEAHVSPDQALRVGANQYTLREAGEHAKALFRCDPTDLNRYEAKLLEEHLPWGLIALSRLVPPTPGTWVNGYGEKIDLHQVLDRAFAAYEQMCSGVRNSLAQGELESLEFRQAINKHSCFGLHAVYGFFASCQHGYRRNDMPARVKSLLDLTIYRMEGDAKAIDREADAAKAMGPEAIKRMAVSQEGRVVTSGSPPPQILEAMRLRSQIKMQGHILEAINYGLLNKLFTLTPDQQQRVKAGEQALYESLVKLRALDLDEFRRWHSKFVSDLVIAIGHAVRALKLLTPNNPDLAGQIAQK
ncbi:MAG: hypothetical protein HYR56_15930 [Acidobacteria bacterium]|nr:hypothetical protein [Acidobacteriota bacterium]MBI3426308.1 hypothetical protein [Acidobacteriota bacterium]